MKESRNTRKVDAGLDEEAARWSERLREAPDDSKLKHAFEIWVSADPARRSAYERAEQAWAVARAHADAPELSALRSETLSRTVIQREARRFSTRAFVALAASLLIVLLGAGAWFGEFGLRPQADTHVAGVAPDGGKLYETAIGQRLVITLEDDSVVTLDTASRISVSYSRTERTVRLQSGQAFFKVARDTARPFAVLAGEKRVVAVGTQFDVRLSRDGVAVTLVEGKVRVEPAAAPDVALTTELMPGQQLVARTDAVALVRQTDVSRATSWRHGQAIFENDSLSSAVAEMNRYSRRPIVLNDARLAGLRISGAFETGQSDAFVEALTTYFPTIVVKANNESRIELGWRN